MRSIAVINQKGGVGKTTTSANLGAALGAAGQRVLLIDLDPQGHLTMHYGIEPEPQGGEQAGVYDLLCDEVGITDVIRPVRDNISLIPANIDLAAAETELANVVGREVILREALDKLPADYDVVLMDCPPSLGVLTINALASATEVIIPLQPHFLALQGLGKLLETVTLVRQRINPDLVVSGIALCMFDTGTRLASEVVDDLRGFLNDSRGGDVPWAGARLYETRIRRNIKLAESPSYGQTVFDYAPGCNGAVDYADLANEVIEQGGNGQVIASATATSQQVEGEVSVKPDTEPPSTDHTTNGEQPRSAKVDEAGSASQPTHT